MRANFSICLLFLTGVLFCTESRAEIKIVALPNIEDGIVRLRVAHAINPRLPKLDGLEIQRMLKVMEKTVLDHFQIKVLFESPVEVDVTRLLGKIPAQVLQYGQRDIFDFKSGTGNRRRLINGYHKTLKLRGQDTAHLVKYTQPYLVKPVSAQTKRALAEALVETHLARLGYWKSILALDGRSIIDETNANEWKVWDALGYSHLPYDLIITNQPIVSAEYSDIGVNTALRGGVTAGTTSYSKLARYNTYAMASTFPFTEYARLPKGTSDIKSRIQAINLAGQYSAHEIGHMLLLLGHPYGNDACVMQPEPLFNFTAWAENLDATKCKVGSSKAMKPGAAKVGFHPDW
jgi:hypothetical protein